MSDVTAPMSPSTARRWAWAAFATLAVGTLWRCLALGRPMWLDEYTTQLGLQAPTLWESLGELRSDTHHPLYFAALYGWSRLGRELPFLRLLSLLFDVGAMLVLFDWLRRTSMRAACLGLAFYAASPMALRFSVELRPYSLLALTTVCTLWAAAGVRRSPGMTLPWAALGLAGSALVATHPVGMFFLASTLAGVAFTIVIRAPGLRWSARMRETAGAVRWSACLPAVGAALVTFCALHFVYSRHVGDAGLAWQPHLTPRLFAQVIAYLFTFDTTAGLTCLLAGGALACGLLVGRSRAAAALLGVAVGHVILVALYGFSGQPIFWYRALLPAIVPVMAFAALQIDAVSTAMARHIAISGALALVALQSADWVLHATRPVEASSAAGAAVQEGFEPRSVALYYPAFMRASVEQEAPNLPQARLMALEAPPPSWLSGLGDRAFAVVRVDFALGADPTLVIPQLKTWRDRLGISTPWTMLLYPSHDLAVAGALGAVDWVTVAVQQAMGPCTRTSRDGLQVVRCDGRPAR